MGLPRGAQIYITEVGLTCALGRGLNVVMDALQANECGLSLHDVHGYPTAVGRVNTVLNVEEPFLSTRDRSTHLALDAVAQTSGLRGYDPHRIGLFWGVGLAGAHWIESTYEQYFSDLAASRLSPWTVPAIMPNATASTLAMKYGVRGACWTTANACASSALAIGQAMQAIQSGHVDAAIVGGSDAMLVPGMLHAWARMRVLARVVDKDVSLACQPFDQNRNGLCLAEGAACLLIEKGDVLQRQGRKALARLSGFGQSCDSMDLTEPSVSGQVHAMQQALKHAGLQPGDIGYLNAHATGTRNGDRVEMMAVNKVWGQATNQCPVSTVKSALGHTMGAAGAIEAVICVGILARKWVPPTLALVTPDSEFEDRWLLAGHGVDMPELTHVMSNSFGFGGTNASLVITKE
ncbi:beta-ketoacyl-[acyl-carrier-protein] synthase family protein [Limnohabitans sp. Rim8]|uniref:beta-ketoacyl-[acyl-carrier-protein] synthase family protein n=1 Tax=Limnohabitans sp. Rim8 TaxID=1100718 RepID=UPI002637083A|nr:beta-ketoacyl-[acyl-carrier-protein] synthase family protein [Limnohabitans sp. Rim8]